MDAQISTIFATLFFIFLLLKLRSKLRTKKSSPRLPPGPWRLPLLGNIHQLAGGELPHRALTGLAKKYGPVMYLQMGEIPTIVISTPETATEVLKTHDLNFSSRARIAALELITYNCTNIGFAPYGDFWRNMRKIATTELLSTRRVQSFRFLRDEETSNLMKWIAKNATSAPINLTQKTYATIYGLTAKVGFGKECSQQEAFISASKEAVRLGVAFNIADLFPSFKFLHMISGFLPELERVHKDLDKILGSIIDDHQKGGHEKADDYQRDLVDVLLEYNRDETLEFSPTIDNIKSVILEIFIAGSETSATTIDWAMLELIKHPIAMKKVQEEVRQVFQAKGSVDENDFSKLPYLRAVIKEALRLHPPVPLLLPRTNSEACLIGGYDIPAKTSAMVNVWAINRDARYWGADAETFKPERFLDSPVEYKGTHFQFIPFGAGRRICPGMNLGTANVELTLAKYLFHFDWNLPAGVNAEDFDMAEAPGFTFKRKEPLHLIPVIVNPPSVY